MDNESLDYRKPIATKIMAGLAVLAILFLIAVPAHCKTSERSHDNSLGVNIPYENPYIYNFGGIVDGAVVEDRLNNEATSIRFQPFGTFELYTEELLFCGNLADTFRGMSGPVVLTYRRVAHETVGGIACHELKNVQKVGK